jgi:hypothetical protein
MVARTQSRPLYAVFLEQVIQIEAVQRERAQATEEYAAGFFDAGRLLGELDDFCWSLDEPELFSRRGTVQILGVISPRGDFIPNPSRERTVSPAMRAAWDAAVAAWRAFVSALRNGEYIATGTHPATGERRDLEPAEWMRTGLVLDVRNGDLLEKERKKRELTERWLSIMLSPAEPKEEIKPGVIDWNDWWQHEVGRRERRELPPEKSYHSDATALIKKRYGVTHVPESGLRRLKAALYRGDVERPKR